jgi:hypothetical protein
MQMSNHSPFKTSFLGFPNQRGVVEAAEEQRPNCDRRRIQGRAWGIERQVRFRSPPGETKTMEVAGGNAWKSFSESGI